MHCIGGSKGGTGDAVFGKNLKNNSNFGSWRTPRGKSWIRHCVVSIGSLFSRRFWEKIGQILSWQPNFGVGACNLPLPPPPSRKSWIRH